MKQVTSTIISNKDLSKGKFPQANLMCLSAPDMAIMAKPGQFIMLSCGSEVMLRRPLSIHQIDHSGKIFFLFVVIGKGTNWLSERQKGDKLDLLGPLGNGFAIKPTSKKLLIIGGGIGISPLAFLAQDAVQQGKQVSLILGARKKHQIYQQKLPSRGIETIILTDDGSKGIKGKISDFQYLPDYINKADEVFACGPLPMYQSLSNLMQQRSWHKPVQISLETRMGCGIGTCYSCSIKTTRGMKTVCHDGPVFNMNEIIWQEVKI